MKNKKFFVLLITIFLIVLFYVYNVFAIKKISEGYLSYRYSDLYREIKYNRIKVFDESIVAIYDYDDYEIWVPLEYPHTLISFLQAEYKVKRDDHFPVEYIQGNTSLSSNNFTNFDSVTNIQETYACNIVTNKLKREIQLNDDFFIFEVDSFARYKDYLINNYSEDKIFNNFIEYSAYGIFIIYDGDIKDINKTILNYKHEFNRLKLKPIVIIVKKGDEFFYYKQTIDDWGLQ